MILPAMHIYMFYTSIEIVMHINSILRGEMFFVFVNFIGWISGFLQVCGFLVDYGIFCVKLTFFCSLNVSQNDMYTNCYVLEN